MFLTTGQDGFWGRDDILVFPDAFVRQQWVAEEMFPIAFKVLQDDAGR